MGVHVSRGGTIQGVAINLSVRPELFESPVSCGVPNLEMANLQDMIDQPISVEQAGTAWAKLYAKDLRATIALHGREQLKHLLNQKA